MRGEGSKMCQVNMGETEWSQGGTGPKSGVGTTVNGPSPRRLSWEREPPGRRQTAADCCGLQTAQHPFGEEGQPLAPSSWLGFTRARLLMLLILSETPGIWIFM